MKLKVKIQVLVARNCWGTNAIPKLPQREFESSTDVDVDNTIKPRNFLFLAPRDEAYMVSENVWRMKKSKLEQHSRHNNHEIITAV